MDNITQSTNELSRLDSPSYNNDDTIYIYDIPLKRYFLPLIGGVGFLAFEELHTYFYMPLLFFFCSLILFWNYPEIIIFMNSKPLYYEELFLINTTPNVTQISSDVRKKFEYIFDYSLLFTNALFTAGLADYWLYQSWNTNSYIEIIGVTGGILKIFQSVNYITGGIILYAVRFRIEREINDTNHNINIELDTISHNLEEIDPEPNNLNHVNNSNIIFSMPTSTEVSDDIIVIHTNDTIDSNKTIFVHMPNKI